MELVDIVDNNGNYIKTQNRQDILNDNEYIKSVHIYILNDKEEIYIQQRSEAKLENPNLWEVVGGGVLANEDVKTAALREVAEETKITFDSIDLIPIGTLIAANYYVNSFIAFAKKSQEFIPQLSEVKNSMFVSFDEILDLINNDRFYSSSFGLFQRYYKEHIDGKY